MNIGMRQTANLQHRLVMTPKLQQAIQVLLMSRLDLNQHLSQQLELNPLLEEISDDGEIEEITDLEGLDPDTQWNEPEEIIDREDKEPDFEWTDFLDDSLHRGESGEFEHWENNENQRPADIACFQVLHDFLMEQLSVAPFSEIERRIGEQIIGNLDDNGRLRTGPLFDLNPSFQTYLDNEILSEHLRKAIEKGLRKELENDEISLSQNATVTLKSEDSCWLITDVADEQTYTVKKEDGQLNIYTITLEDIAAAVGCDLDDVEAVLYFIQNHFEPIGIAYRTIPETLLTQMRAAQIENSLAEKVIRHHWEDLTNNHLQRIAQGLGVQINEVVEARELIGTLDPYPGRHFFDPRDPRAPETIIPDVTVEKIDGEYRVTTNDDGMPRLRLNPVYVDWMINGNKNLDSKTKEWLEVRRTQARDLLQSIVQRRQTIARVTDAIFEVQADFLEQGVEGLKPLVLKQIAEMAGVHESTVSRVTSNKYVETPQGIYRLKYFFSGELLTDSGSNMAATTVKEKIKEMIDNEDAAKPLSDKAISDALKAQGIHTARRTVAKYREELDILPSPKRKRKW
jgi:RNA polymerase sigma-54 factor